MNMPKKQAAQSTTTIDEHRAGSRKVRSRRRLRKFHLKEGTGGSFFLGFLLGLAAAWSASFLFIKPF